MKLSGKNGLFSQANVARAAGFVAGLPFGVLAHEPTGWAMSIGIWSCILGGVLLARGLNKAGHHNSADAITAFIVGMLGGAVFEKLTGTFFGPDTLPLQPPSRGFV